MAVRRENNDSKSLVPSRFTGRTTVGSGDDQIIDQLRRISSVSQEDFEKMRLAEKDNDFFELRKATDITNPDTKGDPCPPLPIKLIHGSFKHILGVREACSKNGTFLQRCIELRRKPGESLGFYIRQGDGWEREDGIFVSRVVLGTDVDIFELLRVGDEIIKVNKVDVRTMGIEDVSALMQMTRRLILTMKVLTPGAAYRRKVSKADSVRSTAASDPGMRDRTSSGRFGGARSHSIAYGTLPGNTTGGMSVSPVQRRVSTADRRLSSVNKLSHQSNYKVANMVIGKNKDSTTLSRIPTPANAVSPVKSSRRSTKSPVAGRRALSPIRESMVDLQAFDSDTEAGVGSSGNGRRGSRGGSASVVSWSDQIYGIEGSASPTKMKYKPTASDRRKSEATRVRPK